MLREPVSQWTRDLLVQMIRDMSLDVGSTEPLLQPHIVGAGDFAPLQEGRLYHDLTQQINPATGKKWNLTEIAGHFSIPYYRVRKYHALMLPCEASSMCQGAQDRTS